jgi:hypothetical protein
MNGKIFFDGSDCISKQKTHESSALCSAGNLGNAGTTCWPRRTLRQRVPGFVVVTHIHAHWCVARKRGAMKAAAYLEISAYVGLRW